MKKEEKTKVEVKGKMAKFIDPKRVTYITEEVAYWRKANQIHAWFIKNCADGDGDKTEMSVSREQLSELLDDCKRVLQYSKLVKGKIANGQNMNKDTGKWEDIMEDGKYIKDASVAQALLPTQSGFFFGGTTYDQYYIQDLKHTVKVLEKLLKGEEDFSDYHYIASW